MSHEPDCDFAIYGEGITHVQSYRLPKRSYTSWLAHGMRQDDPNRSGEMTDLNFEVTQRGAYCTCKIYKVKI